MQHEKQARLLQFQRDVKKRVQCLDKLKKQQQLQSNLNAVSLCNTISVFNLISPNKVISVFWVTGLKILGSVVTLFFFRKKYNFMHFERLFAFQNASNNIFFQKT